MRIVAHIDMDAFFASVEERDRPHLRGMPIAVGSDPEGGEGRGVVATANYPARKYGLHSALPIRKAWELSEAARKRGLPPVAFISGRFGKYEEASDEVFGLVRSHSKTFEQIGVDEGYIDLTHLKSFKTAREKMKELKAIITKKAKLPCTIGVGANKMIAKIASERGKPDGLLILTPQAAEKIFPELPIGSLPGIGFQSEKVFKRKGVTTVAQARTLPWQTYVDLFGKHGFAFYERVMGNDSREVKGEEVDAKSIGKDETVRHDIRTFKEALPLIERHARSLMRSLAVQGFVRAKTVNATVRLSDFSTFNRSVTPRTSVSSEKELITLGMKLVLPFFDRSSNPRNLGIRLIGLRLEHLEK